LQANINHRKDEELKAEAYIIGDEATRKRQGGNGRRKIGKGEKEKHR
jgi:hypothetical protein